MPAVESHLLDDAAHSAGRYGAVPPRHDVFPDAGRTQPFGTGATCFYNYLDLQIKNDTQSVFQLRVHLTDTDLCGEWRSDAEPACRYEIVEKKHWMTRELWGGFVRHNIVSRHRYDAEGRWLDEQFVAENHAIMMYDPSLPPGQYAE